MEQKEKKPRGYWKNPNNITNEIKFLNEKGVSLNPRSIDNHNKSLRKVAERVFGTWGNAIKEAGLDYDAIKKTKKRTKDSIIKELIERYNTGLPINQNALMQDNIALFSACVLKFGNYKSAIESCGFNYDSIKKQENWTKEKVVNILKNLKLEGAQLNATSIQQEYPLLYNAMYRLFGNFKQAIVSAGLNYDEIKKVKHWTKDEILSTLKVRYKYGLPLNSTFLEKEDESLYTACRNYFGNFESAIKSAGIEYSDVREDIKMINYYGYEFESLVGSVLSELNIKYTKKLNREYQPDFIIKNNVWLDAKLSEWTIYKHKTIEKYEPMCRMLNIIFLRGDREKDEMITNKTRMINVFKLIKQLPKERRRKYLTQIEKLLSQIKEIEI